MKKVSQWIFLFFWGSNVRISFFFWALFSLAHQSALCQVGVDGVKRILFGNTKPRPSLRRVWGKNWHVETITITQKGSISASWYLLFHSPPQVLRLFLSFVFEKKNFEVTIKLLFHFRWVIASAAKDNLKMGDKSEAISWWRTFFSPLAMIFACYTRHNNKLHQSGWIHFHFPTCAKINNFLPLPRAKKLKELFMVASHETHVGMLALSFRPQHTD